MMLRDAAHKLESLALEHAADLEETTESIRCDAEAIDAFIEDHEPGMCDVCGEPLDTDGDLCSGCEVGSDEDDAALPDC